MPSSSVVAALAEVDPMGKVRTVLRRHSRGQVPFPQLGAVVGAPRKTALRDGLAVRAVVAALLATGTPEVLARLVKVSTVRPTPSVHRAALLLEAAALAPLAELPTTQRKPAATGARV
jgi:hypothetical protein